MLTLLADVVSIAGGLFVAMSSLDVSWQGYVLSVREALGVADVFGGLFKAAVFGGMIALIACERGLGARGGAEGVGRATTSAVVTMLFALVAVDALFSVLFNLWGI